MDLFNQKFDIKTVRYQGMVGELVAQYRRTGELSKQIKSSLEIYEFIAPRVDSFVDDHERFLIIRLNRGNYIINVQELSRGGIEGTVADEKLIFRNALLSCASSIILLHNHPSGNLRPSQADIQLTNKMVKAGKILGVPVLDHLILTREAYYSFADQGRI